jgi:pilus assembly protein CpaB
VPCVLVLVMSEKKRLILSIVFAVLATWCAHVYLKQLEAQVRSPIPTSKVVVTSVSIPAGASIEPGMVEELLVPSDTVVPSALRDVSEVTGYVAVTDLAQGEQIVSFRIDKSHRTATLARRVSPALRAVTVNVREDCTFGGLLKPGDRVDIIGTLDNYGSSERSVRTYIQDAEVLAVGDEFLPDMYDQERKNENDSLLSVQSMNPGTVTLALSPEDAETVVLLERYGHMKFALRTREVGNPIQVDPDQSVQCYSLETFEAPTKERLIEVIRGTQLEIVEVNETRGR